MERLDELAPFEMFGAREVAAFYGTSSPLSQQVAALESAVTTSPALVFDLSRSLVESVCKSILHERGEKTDLKFNDLIKRTSQVVQLVPSEIDVDEKTVEQLDALVAAFNGVLLCVTHLRHTYGIASHGRAGSAGTLERAHVHLAARSADLLVHFLFQAHKFFFRAIEELDEVTYDEFAEFNDHVDEYHEPVTIFDWAMPASEVLFYADAEAYQAYRTEFESSKDAS